MKLAAWQRAIAFREGRRLANQIRRWRWRYVRAVAASLAAQLARRPRT